MTDLISTMNDSKWCRLLQALDDLRLPVSYWKFLKDDREFQMPMPGSDDIVEHQGNRGIGDYGVSGPFFFKDVQQVRWPRTWQRNWASGYEPVTEHQPIEALSAALDACGKFDYTVNENDLILFAYRKISPSEQFSNFLIHPEITLPGQNKCFAHDLPQSSSTDCNSSCEAQMQAHHPT